MTILSVFTLLFKKEFDTVEFSIQFLKTELSKLLINCIQDEIFRRKRLSTGANFVHVYLEI